MKMIDERKSHSNATPDLRYASTGHELNFSAAPQLHLSEASVRIKHIPAIKTLTETRPRWEMPVARCWIP